MDWNLVIDRALGPEPTNRAIALLRAMAAVESAVKDEWKRDGNPSDTPLKKQFESVLGSTDVDADVVKEAWELRNKLLHRGRLPGYSELRHVLPPLAQSWALLAADTDGDPWETINDQLPEHRYEHPPEALQKEDVNFSKAAPLVHAFQGHADEEMAALGVCIASGMYEYELYECLRRLGGFDLSVERRSLEAAALDRGLFETSREWELAKTVRNSVAHEWAWESPEALDSAIGTYAEIALALRHDKITKRRLELEAIAQRLRGYLDNLTGALSSRHAEAPLPDRAVNVLMEAFGRLPMAERQIRDSVLLCMSVRASIAALPESEVAQADRLMPTLTIDVRRADEELRWRELVAAVTERVQAIVDKMKALDLDESPSDSSESAFLGTSICAIPVACLVGLGSCAHGCWTGHDHGLNFAVQKAVWQTVVLGILSFLALVAPIFVVTSLSRALRERRNWRERHAKAVEEVGALRERGHQIVRAFADANGERSINVVKELNGSLRGARGAFPQHPGSGPVADAHLTAAAIVAILGIASVPVLRIWEPWRTGEPWWPTGTSTATTTSHRGSPAAGRPPSHGDDPARAAAVSHFNHFEPYRIEARGDFCGFRANLGSWSDKLDNPSWATTYDAIKRAYSPFFDGTDHAFVAYTDGGSQTVGVVFSNVDSLKRVPPDGVPVEMGGTVTTRPPLVRNTQACFAR